MPIDDVDVNDIVTDEDLNEFLGGQLYGKDSMVNLGPDAWDKASRPARQHALDRVLEALRKRDISYSDLLYPTELRFPILYGASEHLYQLAMSTSQGGDVFAEQRRLYSEKFEEALAGLSPTVAGGGTAILSGFGIERS